MHQCSGETEMKLQEDDPKLLLTSHVSIFPSKGIFERNFERLRVVPFI